MSAASTTPASPRPARARRAALAVAPSPSPSSRSPPSPPWCRSRDPARSRRHRSRTPPGMPASPPPVSSSSAPGTWLRSASRSRCRPTWCRCAASSALGPAWPSRPGSLADAADHDPRRAALRGRRVRPRARQPGSMGIVVPLTGTAAREFPAVTGQELIINGSNGGSLRYTGIPYAAAVTAGAHHQRLERRLAPVHGHPVPGGRHGPGAHHQRLERRLAPVHGHPVPGGRQQPRRWRERNPPRAVSRSPAPMRRRGASLTATLEAPSRSGRRFADPSPPAPAAVPAPRYSA